MSGRVSMTLASAWRCVEVCGQGYALCRADGRADAVVEDVPGEVAGIMGGEVLVKGRHLGVLVTVDGDDRKVRTLDGERPSDGECAADVSDIIKSFPGGRPRLVRVCGGERLKPGGYRAGHPRDLPNAALQQQMKQIVAIGQVVRGCREGSHGHRQRVFGAEAAERCCV